MRGRIPTRRLLVLLITFGQLVILLAGVLVFANWLERSLRTIVRQRVLEGTQQFALQAADLIDAMDVTSLERDSTGWAHVQDVIERLKLPNGGYLCLIDAETGRLICHPEIRRDPSLAESEIRDLTLTELGVARSDVRPGSGRGSGRKLLDPDSSFTTVSGVAELEGGSQLLAARRLNRLGALVLAHQPESEIRHVVEVFTARVRAIGVAVTFVLVAGSFLITALLVRQYENRLATINEGLEELVERRSRAVVRSRDAVIFGLAKLAESRDDTTGRHLERIERYVTILVQRLAATGDALKDEIVESIGPASSLHDIGKVGIPDAVLLSPEPLTPEQRAIIEKHPLIGGDTLLAIKQRWGDDPFLVTACEICFAHHEKFDGSGYPFGLKGEMIPLTARIVALADVYDALTSKRSYKSAMSHEEARSIIEKSSGTHFDPIVVEAFLTAEDAFETVRREAAG